MSKSMRAVSFLLIGLMLVMGACTIGCTNAERAQLGGYGKDFKVTVYSGGEVVNTYTSSGKVLTEEKSDGFYFSDRSTGKLVRVSGTITIEEL